MINCELPSLSEKLNNIKSEKVVDQINALIPFAKVSLSYTGSRLIKAFKS